MKKVYVIFEHGKILAIFGREYDAKMCRSVDFNNRWMKEFDLR